MRPKRLSKLLSRGRDTYVLVLGAVATWTDMPSALTELLGVTQRRAHLDLSLMKMVRINVIVTVQGASGAKLFPQYSTDSGSNWSNFHATAADVVIDSGGTKLGAWAAIPEAAKTDCWVRIAGSGGNGTLDPQLHSLGMQFR